jgi:type II pantothenate kinase
MSDHRYVRPLRSYPLTPGAYRLWREFVDIGLDFFITEIPNEVFTYSDAQPMQFTEAQPDVYPYLLVNIGSGVSMIKVSGPNQFQRVGGTHLGGGTFWGIMSLLTGARTFDEMLAMADRGDNGGVDMLVGDIYGMDYNKIGLKSNAIASSFGKVFRLKRTAEQDAEDGEGLARPEPDTPKFRHEDMSRSLLFAIRYSFAACLSLDGMYVLNSSSVTTSGRLRICSRRKTK